MPPGDASFPTALPTLDTLFRAANRAESTLAVAITPSSTSIVLGNSDLFPATGCITIDDEIIYYTSNDTGTETLTTLTRGADGTSAASHALGAKVFQNIIARMHQVQNDEIIAVATKIGTGADTPAANEVLRGTGVGTSAWGQVATGDIANDAITYAKLQNVNDARLVGRSAGSAGDAQEITVTAPLSLSGGALAYQSVTDDRLLGRSAGSPGAPQEITVGTGLDLNAGVLSAVGGTTTTLVRKASDETRTSDTTLANDASLLFAVGANETWVFEIYCFVTGVTAGDFKCTVTAPSGATYVWAVEGVDTGAASQVGSMFSAGSNTTTSRALGTSGAGITNAHLVKIVGSIVNGANAGNLQLQWAQNTSDVTATTVRAGSFLIAHKL